MINIKNLFMRNTRMPVEPQMDGWIRARDSPLPRFFVSGIKVYKYETKGRKTEPVKIGYVREGIAYTADNERLGDVVYRK